MKSSGSKTVDVLIGLQHGDEGKGRFVDGLIEENGYDTVARYNGGPNAGHTIEFNGTKLALHQLPSGVHHPKAGLYIAALCVVNPEKLMREIEEVEGHGLAVRNRLRISPLASVIQPAHIIRDKATMGGIGTTGNGIGATYADAKARLEGDRQLDIRTAHLSENFRGTLANVRRNLVEESERLGVASAIDVDALMETFERNAEAMLRFIDSDPIALIKEWRRGNRILLEGAQAFGLDNTYGATPDVTSSNVGVQAALLSTALPPESVRRTIGVAKAIPSRVGYGPFPSEFGGKQSELYAMDQGGALHTEEWERNEYGDRIAEMLRSDDPLEMGIALRMMGGEYGATTKRPRRLGALDLVQLRYAIEANAIQEVYLTKVDRLTDFAGTADGTIPVVNTYLRDGHNVEYMPTTNDGLSAVQAAVHPLEVFTQDLGDCREADKLPHQALAFLHDVEQRIGATIRKIGVGPRREQMVAMGA